MTRLGYASRTLALAGLLGLTGLLAPAQAAVGTPAGADPAVEAKVVKISSELRCLVCQNETIAASNAELAVDLRAQVREMVKRGDTQTQIIDYMTARYGDFVLYRPPVRASTALLWFGPTVLLVIGVATLFFILRRRSRMTPDRFEADPEELPP